jgi:hypothetical protein
VARWPACARAALKGVRPRSAPTNTGRRPCSSKQNKCCSHVAPANPDCDMQNSQRLQRSCQGLLRLGGQMRVKGRVYSYPLEVRQQLRRQLALVRRRRRKVHLEELRGFKQGIGRCPLQRETGYYVDHLQCSALRGSTTLSSLWRLGL